MKDNVNYRKLLAILRGNQGYITRSDVDKAGINSWFLTDFVRKTNLHKIAPGFYADDTYPIDDYFLLQRRFPKYIFYGTSALYLHNLTDKIPPLMSVIAPQGYNPSRHKIRSLAVTKISNSSIYKMGITEVKTIFGNVVYVYDKEKTICDLIKHRDRYDAETFIKAIKIYAKSKPDQPKLFRYAREMNIVKKVFEIMEIVMNED